MKIYCLKIKQQLREKMIDNKLKETNKKKYLDLKIKKSDTISIKKNIIYNYSYF